NGATASASKRPILRRLRRDRPHLRAPRHERSIRLMEYEIIDLPVRAAAELHPESLVRVDDEAWPLIGTQFAGRFGPDRQCELSVTVLPDDNGRPSVQSEPAGAPPAEGGIGAIAGRNAGEDDIFDQWLERSRQTRNISFAVGCKRHGQPVG